MAQNVAPRLARAGAVLLLAGMTATGCAGTEPPKETETTNTMMTAREGGDKVVELVSNTTQQLAVTGWWARNGTAAAGICQLRGPGLGGMGELKPEDQGAAYSFDLWGPPGDDRIADAERVATYWESLGMSVRTAIAPLAPDHPTVYANGGPVLRAMFDTHAAEGLYNIGAIAPCSPGKATELNDAEADQRDQGKTFPGDEYLSDEQRQSIWPNGVPPLPTPPNGIH